MNGFIAGVLLALAARVTPAERREWARAMRAETACLPESERLSWAIGCFLAAIKQRFTPMPTNMPRISRWVMFIESVGAFGPLTVGWWEVTFGGSGFVRLTSGNIHYYTDYPGGTYLLTMLCLATVVALLGPIGLFLGLRYVMLGRGIANRAFGWALVGAMWAYCLFGTIAGYLYGPDDWRFNWEHTLAFNLLPTAVVLHLMYLGKPAMPEPGDTRLAAG
jgi:hypothetical protein